MLSTHTRRLFGSSRSGNIYGRHGSPEICPEANHPTPLRNLMAAHSEACRMRLGHTGASICHVRCFRGARPLLRRKSPGCHCQGHGHPEHARVSHGDGPSGPRPIHHNLRSDRPVTHPSLLPSDQLLGSGGCQPGLRLLPFIGDISCDESHALHVAFFPVTAGSHAAMQGQLLPGSGFCGRRALGQ